MARRFDDKQLRDVNAFLATDSGHAFGSQSMAMWVDADVLRAMVGSFPAIIEAMPSAAKRLEAETAHLPKPPKKKGEDKKPTTQNSWQDLRPSALAALDRGMSATYRSAKSSNGAAP
jgi:hypothetical protein